jgi:hypothetical protein
MESMRRARAIAATLLTIGTISSVLLAQRAAARRDAPVPFAVGETLTYDVTWSTYLVAGTATSTVRERRDAPGGPTYHIVAEGRPIPLLSRLYNMYYRMETMIDAVTLLPQRGSLYSEEGGRKATAVTEFDRQAGRARYELQAETGGKVEFEIPPQAQDGLSTLYVLRAMRFKTGDSFTFPVSDSGAMYTVKVDVGPLEKVAVPYGERQAWNVAIGVVDTNNQPVTKNAVAWISNDDRKLPLKLQGELPVGYFVLLLRDAR